MQGSFLEEAAKQVIKFTVLGRPQQRGSKDSMVLYRDGKPIMKNGRVIVNTVDKNRRSVGYMQEARAVAAHIMQDRGYRMIDGPCVLSVSFFFARPKGHYKPSGGLRKSAPVYHAQTPDLAKLIRCLEDALTGIVYRDDRLICHYESMRRYWCSENEPERAEVVVREL